MGVSSSTTVGLALVLFSLQESAPQFLESVLRCANHAKLIPKTRVRSNSMGVNSKILASSFRVSCSNI